MNTHPVPMKIIGLALAAAAAALPAHASAQTAGWNGRYVWEEAVGRQGGSTPQDSVAAFVTHRLAIGPGNGPTGCTLIAQGFQTNKRIQCTVTPRGNAIVVKFYKFGPDTMFPDRYARGQALFTLTRVRGGIATALQGLAASSRTTPRSGTLFRRAG